MAAWIVVAICGVVLSTVRAAEVAATPANSASEIRREKVELLRDGSVAESLARRIDVGFGSVRIDGEKSNVPLSSLTADQVLSAETTKVPTPDLDADAVGGLLQLTSRRTFDQAAPTMRASAGGGYDALTGRVNPEASVTYGRPLGERFGFVVTGSGGRETSRGQGIDSDWFSQGNRGNLEEVMLQEEWESSIGMAFNGLVDWKTGDKSAAQLRASFDVERDRGTQRSLAYRLDDPGRSATSASEVERVLQIEEEEERRSSLAASFAHKDDAWEFDVRLSHARRADDTPDDRRYQFHQQGVGLDYEVIDSRFPRVTGRPGAQPDDPARSVLDEFQRSRQSRRDGDSVAALDLKWKRIPGWPAAWAKIGAKFRGLRTERVEANDVFGATGLRLTEALGDWRRDDLLGGRYRMHAFPDAAALGELFDAAPQRFQLNVESTRSDTDPANYHVQQDVLATYLMTAAALGRRVRVLAGARVERTMNDFTGYEVVFDQAGRYEATNRLAAASDYTNVFPGIHLLITPVPKLELYASWTRSIRRPDYDQLVPARRVDRASLEIYEGNPALRPTLYTNVDLAADYAYHAGGRVAVEVFHRDIADTRLERRARLADGPFAGFDRNRPENGGGAQETGFEIKWKQSLAVAGPLAKDLTIDANYTFTDTTQELDNRPGEKVPLAQQPRNLLTLQLAYERGPFFGSVELNHRSLQLDSAGPDAAEDRFRPAHTMWDLSLSYQFHPRWRTFVDVENVTEVPSRIYEGDPSRVEEYWLDPRRFRFGVKWEM